MNKVNSMLTSRVYAAKRQYPMLKQIEKQIYIVEKELNKETNKRK